MKTIIVLLTLGYMLSISECVPQASLTSVPNDLQGNVCQSVRMTCRTQELAFLQWFISDFNIIFTFTDKSVQFPLTIYNTSEVLIKITNATPGQSDNFNGTSVLTSTTLALDMLDVDSIACGTGSFRSDTIDLTMLDVQATPPPSPSCFLTSSLPGTLAFSIRWPGSFTTAHGVTNYRVSVSPDPSSCFSDQVSPDDIYSCSGLVRGTEHTVTVSAIIICDVDQEGERASFSIEPQVPQVTTAVSVEPIYDQNAELSQVIAHWMEEPQSHISQSCTFSVLNYILVLEDNMGRLVEEKTVNSSSSCRDGPCNTTLSLNSEQNENYHIILLVSNSVGNSSANITSNIFAGSVSSLINATFDFVNCSTSVTCTSPETNGSCMIQYGQDPSYQDLSPPNQTFLNSPITLPFMRPSTYFYLITVTINSSLTFQIRGNFSNGGFDARLTADNEILLALGMVFFFINIAIAVFLTIIQVKFKKGSWLSLILFICGVILIVVCTALWIAVWALVAPQDDTCNPSWQSSRDDLVISAHLFSDLTSFLLIAAVVMVFIAGYEDKYFLTKSRHKPQTTKPASTKTNMERAAETHGKKELIQMRGAGGRVKELEKLDDDKFVVTGESRPQGLARVQEKKFQTYNPILSAAGDEYSVPDFKPPTTSASGKSDDNQYSVTTQSNTQTVQVTVDTHYSKTTHSSTTDGVTGPSTSSTYSPLNQPSTKRYARLNHQKNVASGQSTPPSQGQEGIQEYGELGKGVAAPAVSDSSH